VHAHIHPSSTWFALQIARGSVDQRFQAQSPAWVSSLRAITVPRAPLPLQGVTPRSVTFSCNIGRRYSALFAHTGSCARPKPSRSLGLSPCATSPCRLRRTPAGSWPFPTLSPQSLYGCLDPYPASLIRCTRSFLPGRHRPHLSLNRFGVQEHPP
jgi:hypothetical protein